MAHDTKKNPKHYQILFVNRFFVACKKAIV